MNNRNPLKTLAFLLVPTVLALSPLAIAQVKDHSSSAPGVSHQSMQNREAAMKNISAQLGLSAEQSRKVEATMKQGHQQSSALKQKLHTKKAALMQYVRQPNATQSKALAMNNDINELQRQIGELRLKTLFAMRAHLTPEQLQKFQQLKPPRHGGPHGPECPGGPGKSLGSKPSGDEPSSE